MIQPNQPFYFASTNKGKFLDLQKDFNSYGIEILLPESINEVAETGTTYIGNAYLKAKSFFDLTGLPCLADDSGLEIEALDRAPGVYSARFIDPTLDHKARNLGLLDLLKNTVNRKAVFISVLCFCVGEDDYIVVEGKLDGAISTSPRGKLGWGYEPVFEYESSGKTLSELRDAQIAFTNHRTRAVEKLITALKRKPFITNLA